MSFTRKSIADYLDSYDDEIASWQESKRELMQDYRAQLAAKGFGKAQIKAEVEALKVAMRRRRAIVKKGADEVESADALADEIFVEISAPAPRATRTREIIEKFDAETGEITEQPETAHQSATSEGESDAIAKSADDRSVFENDLIDGAGLAGQEAGRQPPVETCNDEAPTESAADTISATNFQAPTSRPGSAVNPADDLVTPATEKSGLAEPALNRSSAPAANTKSAPIPDDDFTPPAFMVKERAERNERCQNPLTCKFGNHPQKITCSTCATAWAIAQRKARAA